MADLGQLLVAIAMSWQSMRFYSGQSFPQHRGARPMLETTGDQGFHVPAIILFASVVFGNMGCNRTMRVSTILERIYGFILTVHLGQSVWTMWVSNAGL